MPETARRHRGRAILELALAGLGFDRLRTVTAIVGVVVAVLAVTLLVGGGMGVLSFGEEQFERADRDLWVTGGPIGLTSGGGGALENSIHGAHPTSQSIAAHEGVRNAVPLLFQRVYVSPDGESFDTIIATGVPGTGGSAVSIESGEGFAGSDHYADGNYSGPLSHEVLIDRRTADRYNLSVGDRLYVGGTLAAARDNAFEVVGISGTFAQFLGTATVTLPLAELQTVTGSTGTDPATLITVTVEEDHSVTEVQRNLEESHPDLTIRTNREQLETVLVQQASVITGALVLVLLAIVAGIVLTSTLLSLYVYQHRRQFTMLAALGVSRRSMAGVVGIQGLVIGVAGAVLGGLLTVPAAALLNTLVGSVTGFEGLIIVSPLAIAAGGVIAVVIGTIAALAAMRRVPVSGVPDP